ncbi:MAG: ATP-binding protein [Candidatus Omnitrophota bacterium]
MRSEDITKIFEAFIQHDSDSFHKTALDIIENERRLKHHLLVEQLEKILNKKIGNGNGNNIPSFQSAPIPRDNEKGFRLLSIKKYFLNWEDAILENDAKDSLKQIVKEVQREDVLGTYGLKPKQKILFYGPPGTGKTLSAKVLSSIISYPTIIVNFESIISSYLGETSSNLRKVFDYIEKGRWLVLFDEFDIIGKQRDDPTEHGEIKRVVNNFMLMLEHYEGDSIIIAASNHPHLLDIGVWRRFDEVIFFGLPDKKSRENLFEKYLKVMTKDVDIKYENLAEETTGFSGADIEQACLNALRRIIIEDRKNISMIDLKQSIAKQKDKLKAIGIKIDARRTS